LAYLAHLTAQRSGIEEVAHWPEFLCEMVVQRLALR
jgi:hypothetical protein